MTRLEKLVIELEAQKAVDRAAGKTAIARKKLSAPMQIVVDKYAPKCVYDHGCGRGSDIEILRNHHQVSAWGYDPQHFPAWSLPAYEVRNGLDTITCFYVLNVIEDKEVRTAVVKDLLKMVEPGRQLFLAVRTDKIVGELCGDGVRMKSGSFQKSFKRGELYNLVLDLLPSYKINFGGFGLEYINKGMVRVTRKAE